MVCHSGIVFIVQDRMQKVASDGMTPQKALLGAYCWRGNLVAQKPPCQP